MVTVNDILILDKCLISDQSHPHLMAPPPPDNLNLLLRVVIGNLSHHLCHK